MVDQISGKLRTDRRPFSQKLLGIREDQKILLMAFGKAQPLG
jgi:hypothetical protein